MALDKKPKSQHAFIIPNSIYCCDSFSCRLETQAPELGISWIRSISSSSPGWTSKSTSRLRCWNTDDNLKHNPHLTRNHIISALPPKFPSYLYSWNRFLSNLWSYFPLDLLISFPHCLDYYFSTYLAWSFHFLNPVVFGDVSQRSSTCLAFTASNGILFSCCRANLPCHLFQQLEFPVSCPLSNLQLLVTMLLPLLFMVLPPFLLLCRRHPWLSSLPLSLSLLLPVLWPSSTHLSGLSLYLFHPFHPWQADWVIFPSLRCS